MFSVLTLDMSWNSLFNMRDSIVGFLLRAVYGTLETPSIASKLTEEKDGMCNQIESHVAYHLKKRVINLRRPVRKQRREIPFVKALSR